MFQSIITQSDSTGMDDRFCLNTKGSNSVEGASVECAKITVQAIDKYVTAMILPKLTAVDPAIQDKIKSDLKRLREH